ncbi:MAG: ATP-binding protein [Lentimicrobiaceae bacterium]|jgi:predicted AAA+ superfamily ATPase|nr:ATP-binding protein [Lentimicrobiaceae bacterium]
MQKLLDRKIETFVNENLSVFPAVAILGPRQCGKSTLVQMLYQNADAYLYLDLQNLDDLNKLREPMLFFQANQDVTICLDEIQLAPELFSVLRSEIDRNRRPGRFILLGSASQDIIQKTSESLAGRVGLIELTPFTIEEVAQSTNFELNKFWLRGGYPDSYLASTDQGSALWRENFLRTYVERDIPQLGFQIPALQLRRLLTMCAHSQGQLFNSSKLGESLGVTYQTIRRYIDLMEQTFILRSLPPFEKNIKKRLIKSPKIYVRDSGLLHRLLQIDDFNTLMGNPVFGASWEGFVIENIIASLRDCQFSFYRSAAGDELDLIIERGVHTIAVECKASSAPQVTKGFWGAIETVKPDKTYIVSPVSTSYIFKNGVEVCGLNDFLKKVEL